jgi:protein-glutamine gamma-glutamyltransferase
MHYQAPVLQKNEWGSFYKLQSIRCLLAVIITVFMSYMIDLGTSAWLLSTACIAGVLISGRLLIKQWPSYKVALIHIVLYAACYFLYSLSLNLIDSNSDFQIYRIASSLHLIFIFYLISLLSTWFFWRKSFVLTVESIVAGTVFIWIFSGHRNYNLHAPKKVISYAWDFGIEPQHFFLALGIGFILLLTFYLIEANNRPIFQADNPIPQVGKTRISLGIIIPSIIIIIFISYASYVNQYYTIELSRASEGVGTESSEGNSPLGFHSAVGKTKQPAALVRLEGDYRDNPWSPMLYLREGALSRYDGKQFVIASNQFDKDVPRIPTGQPYIGLESTEKETFRQNLVQSIYLLTKHQTPFAIDYPQSIRLIKNPDEPRFLLAYQAVSIAPTAQIENILYYEVGDESWDLSTWEHYLRAPGSLSPQSSWPSEYENAQSILDEHGEDLRYAALAQKLTRNITPPVIKAGTIAQFLSEESIYTRAPGHQATDKGDPVAPYLFSEEKRGYCVHFAHAAVYMMRLAGIPARIATGYLTDLSYAKDGHILLQLGDRHAWPEIYVRGIGWTVIDVTPSQAENEQVLVPDEKLLEELMGKLDPVEELLTEPSSVSNQSETISTITKIINKQSFIFALITALVIFIGIKLWLRFGWYTAQSDKEKAMRAYLSICSLLADLGVYRHYGETRVEFADRVKSLFEIDSKQLTSYNDKCMYCPDINFAKLSDINNALLQFDTSFNHKRPKWKRILAFFSPLSLTRFGKW